MWWQSDRDGYSSTSSEGGVAATAITMQGEQEEEHKKTPQRETERERERTSARKSVGSVENTSCAQLWDPNKN